MLFSCTPWMKTVNGKVFLWRDEDSEWGGEIESWSSILTLTFGTAWPAELSAVPAGRCLPQGSLWYSFMLEAEWTPGLLHADKGIGHVEVSKDTTRNRTRNLPTFGALPDQLQHSPRHTGCNRHHTVFVSLTLIVTVTEKLFYQNMTQKMQSNSGSNWQHTVNVHNNKTGNIWKAGRL